MDARQKILPIAFHALLLACTLHVGAGSALAQSATRDVTPTARVAQEVVPIEGEYWALIIGIDEYQYVPPLKTAVTDAEGIRDVLMERYDFEPDHTTMLLNEDATRNNIEGALIRLGLKAGANDSVFIYYAGHGQYSDDHRLGWWVPVEGRLDEPGSYILDANVRSYVASMQARHVSLVVDSCFSGTLFASNRALPPITDKYFNKLYGKKSRWGFTSGGTEPVADQGVSGHRALAYHFINFLKENTEPYLVPSHIADNVIPLVANNSDQMPRSQPLQGANDQGGQFVFRLASVAGALEEQQQGLQQRLEGQQQEQLERMRQEQEKLAEERRRFEEERLAEERQRAQEVERLRVKEARLQQERLAEDWRRAEEMNRLRREAARLADEKRRLKEEQESEDFSFSGGF